MTPTPGTEPLKCLDDHDNGANCSGPVEYRHPLSGTVRPFPRCDSHWDARLKKQEEIVSRYAPFSDVPPSGFAPGDQVVHSGQIFAYSHPGGTAKVVEVLGPYHDGSYEYVVDACENFANFPSATNPMTRRTQWASYMTRPAYSESGA